MTAPTPERRVGEALVEEIIAQMEKAIAAGWFRSPAILHKDHRDLALDLLDERAANARLTAEVERLTKEKAEALALADEALALGRVSDDQWCTKEGDRYDRVATRLAALSLPTPAPEATNGTG